MDRMNAKSMALAASRPISKSSIRSLVNGAACCTGSGVTAGLCAGVTVKSGAAEAVGALVAGAGEAVGDAVCGAKMSETGSALSGVGEGVGTARAVGVGSDKRSCCLPERMASLTNRMQP